MSAELTRARQQLAQVRTYIKQGKVGPAAQALHSALLAMLKNPLMKSEREEFERLVSDAVAVFSREKMVISVYPLKIDYVPGDERALYEVVKGVLEGLEQYAVEQAREQMEAMDARKREWLARGIQELGTDQGRGLATLKALLQEHSDDPELRGSVGEALLKAGMYEPAVDYLTEALDAKPDMLPHYNNVGIALRKLLRFETAEKYYLRASQYLRNDPNLYFNIGRLYVDWGKWPKAVRAAGAALKLDPEFAEAKKLYDYAQKRVEQDGKEP